MKWWMLVLEIVVIFIMALGLVFYATGGRGLTRIIRPYLMADIPDKRYGWSDFVPNSDTKRVSGFYSPQLSGDNGVAIWTLAGILRFYHQQDLSVYNYRDVCNAWKQLTDTTNTSRDAIVGKNVETNYFDLDNWKQEMNPEYFVTIQWIEKDGKRVVDKLWSVSGQYKVLGQVGGSVCE